VEQLFASGEQRVATMMSHWEHLNSSFAVQMLFTEEPVKYLLGCFVALGNHHSIMTMVGISDVWDWSLNESSEDSLLDTSGRAGWEALCDLFVGSCSGTFE